MYLFQRILLLCCVSLLATNLWAANNDDEELNINKPGTSLMDLLKDRKASELVIAEEPFSLPATTQFHQWTSFDSEMAFAGNRFYLALDSLSQGETDGIFRYAVKIVTRSGAENIRFEGLHCLYSVYRVYAFGNPDGTWLKASNQQWRDIVRNVHNGYAASLYDSFCRTTGRQDLAKIKANFKRGEYDLVPQ